MQERLVYQNKPGTPDSAQTAFPTLKSLYPDLVSLEADLREGEVFLPIDPHEDKTPWRIDLTVGLTEGTEGTWSMDEQLYLVSRSNLDGTLGFVVEQIAEVNWVNGNLMPAGVGARANHQYAESVSITADTGLLLARVGTALKVIVQEPAFVEIADLGSVAGLVRVFKQPAAQAATGVAPMGRKWF